MNFVCGVVLHDATTDHPGPFERTIRGLAKEVLRARFPVKG
jgi:hypothetical protein